jgi:hypothetical protein
MPRTFHWLIFAFCDRHATFLLPEQFLRTCSLCPLFSVWPCGPSGCFTLITLFSVAKGITFCVTFAGQRHKQGDTKRAWLTFCCYTDCIIWAVTQMDFPSRDRRADHYAAVLGGTICMRCSCNCLILCEVYSAFGLVSGAICKLSQYCCVIN